MNTAKSIQSLSEIDDGEVYRSLMSQKFCASDTTALAALHRLSNNRAIDPEHNEKLRYMRAMKKLKDAAYDQVRPSTAYIHKLLKDPELWIRSDAAKATEEDWAFVEKVDRQKQRAARSSRGGRDAHARPENFFSTWAAPSWLGGIRNVLPNSYVNMQ